MRHRLLPTARMSRPRSQVKINFPPWYGNGRNPYRAHREIDQALDSGDSLDASKRVADDCRLRINNDDFSTRPLLVKAVELRRADVIQFLVDRGADLAPARSSSRATATGSSRTTPSSGTWATARRPASRASRREAARPPTRLARRPPPTPKSSSAAGTTRRRPSPPRRRWTARAARATD